MFFLVLMLVLSPVEQSIEGRIYCWHEAARLWFFIVLSSTDLN